MSLFRTWGEPQEALAAIGRHISTKWPCEKMPCQELSFRMLQSVACSLKDSQGFAESCARTPGIKYTSMIFLTGEAQLGYGNPLPMADDCDRLDYSLA